MSPAYKSHKSHPEFEYFRPLRDFLRKAGIALALISFAVISGALVLRAGHYSIADMTLMTVLTNEIQSSVQTTSVTTSALTPVTATTTAESRSQKANTAACDTWAYLDGKCRSRKPRSLSATTDGPFGRSVPPMPPAAPLPPKLASGADAVASAPASVKPIVHSKPVLNKAGKTATSQIDTGNVPKKARKTATSQIDAGVLKKARKTVISQTRGDHVGKSSSSVREERGRDELWSARAYALPDSRNAPGVYERGSWGLVPLIGHNLDGERRTR